MKTAAHPQRILAPSLKPLHVFERVRYTIVPQLHRAARRGAPRCLRAKALPPRRNQSMSALDRSNRKSASSHRRVASVNHAAVAAVFFGTPTFLVSQTVLVGVWIGLNVAGLTQFDLYPFILLNLAFSLQAAYAAPLILLAQTRQADRDKAHADADAQHREALAQASIERQKLAETQSVQVLALLDQNTQLTRVTQELTQRIKELTDEIHRSVVAR
jgi:uncharacterized membrane protein